MNQNEKNMNTVCIPSFSCERRSCALSIYMIPFVAFISMFIVSVLVGGYVAFLSSYLELPVLHISGYVFVPIAVFVLSTGLLIKFALHLLTSYRFESDRIIRGRLKKGVNAKNLSERFPEIAATLLLGSRIGWVIKLMKLNMSPGFAEEYFDTELYDKTEYLNPKQVKDTKRFMVFESDNGKRLRIPKIYEDMCCVDGKERISFGARIIVTSVIVFFIALAIAITDMSISRYKTVTEYEPDILATQQKMLTELEKYGYELDFSKSTISLFKKQVGDRTSEVKYVCDKYGNIINVDLQLYFNAECVDYEAEIRAVVATMNAGFDENELDEFIAAVGRSINGEYAYYRLHSDKYIITLGSSGEYVDIH